MRSYCVDTSSLLQAWNVRYPIDVFPGVWDALDQLIAQRRLVATEMVLDELKRKSDSITDWARARHELFVDLDATQSNEAKRIINLYPRIVEQRRGRNQADPFVIALASLRGMICVTEENTGNATNVRIPYVCQELSIECVNILDIFKRENIRFLLEGTGGL